MVRQMRVQGPASGVRPGFKSLFCCVLYVKPLNLSALYKPVLIITPTSQHCLAHRRDPVNVTRCYYYQM